MKIKLTIGLLGVGLMVGGCREANTFTFANWNIGHYSLGESCRSTLCEAEAPAKSLAYRAFLDEVGADVLGVAEYSAAFTTNGPTAANSAVFGRYARRAVGPDHEYQWNAQFWNDFAFIDTRTLEYPKHHQSVYYVATRLRIHGKDVIFVSTHLDWCTYLPGHEDDRKAQMQKLVDDFRDEPRVVIAGDFNIGIRAADKPTIDDPSEYQVFVKAGYTLGNDGRFKTYPADQTEIPEKGYALDNIIVKGVEILDFKVFSRPDLSDHALVRAFLKL